MKLVRSSRGLSFATAAALCLAGYATSAMAQGDAQASLVKYSFPNALSNNMPFGANSTFFATGHVGPYAVPGSSETPEIPIGTMTGRQFQLTESSMGSTFCTAVPYHDFESDVIRRAQRLLYYEVAQGDDEKAAAAFRYLVMLYGPASTGNGNLTREERRQADIEQRQQDAELEANLHALISVKVPTVDEQLAALPRSRTITAEQRAAMEHARQVKLNRVKFAERLLERHKERQNVRQRGISSDSTTVRCNFEKISELYGDAERARAEEALAIIREGLKYAPMSPRLSAAYLDVFYDKAVAELQYIKNLKVTRARTRLGLVAPQGQFAIDTEIALLEEIVARYEGVLSGLSEFLSDRCGVDTTAFVDDSNSGAPLGYYNFKRLQPTRNKNSATWLSGNGVVPVPSHDAEQGPHVLFDGYKDYVMILGVLSDYITDSADLARCYVMRGRKTTSEDDRVNAQELVAKVQQKTQVDVALMENMFIHYQPPPGDASGVFAARQGILTASSEMQGVKNFIDGTANALGFNPDYLILIQDAASNTGTNQFDSYDALRSYLLGDPNAIITYSGTLFDAAKADYEAFRENADTLYAETDDILTSLQNRYFEIVGIDDLNSVEVTPANPAPGSEMDQALKEISAIDMKYVELTNTQKNLDEAIASSDNYVNNIIPGRDKAIKSSLSVYQNTVTPEFDTITHWSKVSTGAQGAYETLADATGILTGGDIFGKVGAAVGAGVVAAAGVINTGLQIQAAKEEGDANRNIDLAQATFDANLASVDTELMQQEASIELLALRREQIGNSLEMKSLMAEKAQHVSQRAALLREIEYIKQQAEANLKALSDRYFADPIHQLRSNSSTLMADNLFRDSQRWAFFLQRALEYKWNQPFIWSQGGKNFDSGSILKIRNFIELNELLTAYSSFNTAKLTSAQTQENFLDVLSLRKDFLGYQDGVMYATTDESGTSITVDAVTAFRRRLASMVDSQRRVLAINLNTFTLNKSDGTFFLGPTYDATGRILQAGKYLDKINWMKFRIVTDDGREQSITANLTYSGTCYIRTQTPSNMVGDRIAANEFRKFPFMYAFFDSGLGVWTQVPSQSDTIQVLHSKNSGEPGGTSYQEDFLKERSVATTSLEFSLSTANPAVFDWTKIRDLEIYVNHRALARIRPQ